MSIAHRSLCCILSVSLSLPATPMVFAAQPAPKSKAPPAQPRSAQPPVSLRPAAPAAKNNSVQPNRAAQAQPRLPKALDLTYVQPDAFAITVIHPRAFFEAPEMELFPREIATAAMMKEFGIDPAKIERVTISYSDFDPQKKPSFAAVAHLSEPLAAESIERLKERGEEASVDGKTYWKDLRMGVALHLPNDHTVVVAPEAVIKKVLNAQPADTPFVRRLKQTDFSAHAVAVFSVDAVREQIDALMSQAPALPPQFQQLTRVPGLTSAMELRTEIGGRPNFEWIFQARDEQAAVELERVINDALAIGKEIVLAQVSQQFKGDDPVEQATGKYFNRLAEHVVGLIKPARTGNRVTISVETDGGWATTGILVALLLPAVQTARQAAQRAASNNKMKEIGLAMLNYNAAKRVYPPRANFDDQGKPLLSWRVHLLPYMEEAGARQLYKEFRLDEPWDSEHNTRLIARAPAVYQSLHVPDIGKTNYLVPVGKDTVFGGDKAVRIQDIKDGTSKTIILLEVDADRAVPWTKPEEYEIDLQRPVAGLGNLRSSGQFSAAFADGSVHLLSRDIEPQTFLRLLNKADGLPVQIPK